MWCVALIWMIIEIVSAVSRGISPPSAEYQNDMKELREKVELPLTEDYITILPQESWINLLSRVFNVAAFFTTKTPITFQVWRPKGELSDSGRSREFMLIYQKEISPLALGYNWDLLRGEFIEAHEHDHCGFTYKNPASKSVPLGANSSEQYQNFVGRFLKSPPKVGQSVVMEMHSEVTQQYALRTMAAYHRHTDGRQVVIDCAFDRCYAGKCKPNYCEGNYGPTVTGNPSIKVWSSPWLKPASWHIPVTNTQSGPIAGCFLDSSITDSLYPDRVMRDLTPIQTYGSGCLITDVALPPHRVGLTGARFYLPTVPKGYYELKFSVHISHGEMYSEDIIGTFSVSASYEDGLHQPLFVLKGTDPSDILPYIGTWKQVIVKINGRSPFKVVFERSTITESLTAVALDNVTLYLENEDVIPTARTTGGLPFACQVHEGQNCQWVADPRFTSRSTDGNAWQIRATDSSSVEPRFTINTKQRKPPSDAIFFFPVGKDPPLHSGNIEALQTDVQYDFVEEINFAARCECLRMKFDWYTDPYAIENFWITLRGYDKPVFDYIAAVQGKRQPSKEWKSEDMYLKASSRFQLSIVAQYSKNLMATSSQTGFVAITNMEVYDACEENYFCVEEEGTLVTELPDVINVEMYVYENISETKPQTGGKTKGVLGDLEWYGLVGIFGTVFVLGVVLVISLLVYHKKKQYDEAIRKTRSVNTANQVMLMASSVGVFGGGGMASHASLAGGGLGGVGGSRMSILGPSVLPYQAYPGAVPPTSAAGQGNLGAPPMATSNNNATETANSPSGDKDQIASAKGSPELPQEPEGAHTGRPAETSAAPPPNASAIVKPDADYAVVKKKKKVAKSPHAKTEASDSAKAASSKNEAT